MTGPHDAPLRLIYMTAGSRADALALARMLVDRGLAACVNVIDGMTSVYAWQGAVEESGETVLIAKTRADRVADLTHAVRAAHAYDTPCIVSLPIAAEEGNPDFLAWIRAEATPRDQA